MTWIPTAIVVGLAFGIIHPYSRGGMIQVAIGGIAYGLLQELRQSLYAPIVAHCLHNLTMQFFMNEIYTSLM